MSENPYEPPKEVSSLEQAGKSTRWKSGPVVAFAIAGFFGFFLVYFLGVLFWSLFAEQPGEMQPAMFVVPSIFSAILLALSLWSAVRRLRPPRS